MDTQNLNYMKMTPSFWHHIRRRTHTGWFSHVCLVPPVVILALILFMSFSCNAFERDTIRYIDLLKGFAENLPLRFPIDVCTGKSGGIYIVDSGLHMVLIFNRKLVPEMVIDKTHGLTYPMSVAVDDTGMIYISEEAPDTRHKGRISVFDPLGRKRKTIEFKGFKGAETFMARDMAIDEQGNLYLAGGDSNPLVIISSDGTFIRSIQPIEKTTDEKEINAGVTRVALHGEHLYLLSEWQGRIYVYNRDGKEIHAFGQKGGSTGKLSRAQGLTIDPSNGTSYVMDYMRHTLSIYDPSGRFVREFGGSGRGPGWFNYPKDICIDAQGRLFVADTFNKRIQIFQTGR